MLASPIALLLGSLIVVSVRSGSPHAIWSRLWTLAMGKPRVRGAGGPLQKILDERSTLIQFRVQTGIRARTSESALAVADWATQQGEDLEDVGRCRGFFDVEAVTLRRPLHRALEVFLIAFATGVFLFYLWIAPLVIAPRVWVILPSGTWATLGSKDAMTIWSHHRIAVDDCAPHSVGAARLRGEQLGEKDFADTCEILGGPRYEVELADALRNQRVAAISFAIGASPLAYLAYYACAGALACRNMTRRLQARHNCEAGATRRHPWRDRLNLAKALVARVWRAGRHWGRATQEP